MTDLTKTINLLDQLVAFETVSSDSNLDCADWISNILEPLGARITRSSDTDGKVNLFATIGPNTDGGILLSGHMDVVPVKGQDWSTDPFKMVEKDAKLYGRGTCDMKGFVAACLAMAPEYAALDLKRPLHFALTYEEEVGCLGARVLIDKMKAEGITPAICLVGEPTSMRIIEGHKGMCEYTTEFHGVAGHSSNPEICVNALEYANRFIAKIMEVREGLKPLAPKGNPFIPPYSTSSVSVCHAGHTHNVVPAHAAVEWEMRVLQESDHAWYRGEILRYLDEELRPAMKAAHPSADIVETTCTETMGLEPEGDSDAIRLAKALTGQNSTDVVAFGTEAGLFQKAGISTVICGPGSIEQAHKPDEFIALSELDACLTMLKKLAPKLTA